MDIQLRWLEPLDLIDGTRDGLIYNIHDDDWDCIPDAPGIYVFARAHGDSIVPLYIGRTTSLSDRIWGHLNNNLRLMRGLEDAAAGYRVLLLAPILSRPGQQIARILELVESALIRTALVEGYELLNVQGTRTPVHKITFSGNRGARSWLPSRQVLLQSDA
ncbi:MAG TPA: GIY-YIG nuclease family protein [Burkholderiales bacterium]|nr:GIY-YIG nuclease family protein [Burkholderiales bacterium]